MLPECSLMSQCNPVPAEVQTITAPRGLHRSGAWLVSTVPLYISGLLVPPSPFPINATPYRLLKIKGNIRQEFLPPTVVETSDCAFSFSFGPQAPNSGLGSPTSIVEGTTGALQAQPGEGPRLSSQDSGCISRGWEPRAARAHARGEGPSFPAPPRPRLRKGGEE